MLRSNVALSEWSVEQGFQAGGPVAEIHQTIEARILAGPPLAGDWTDYIDQPSLTERRLHGLSRMLGVLALGAGLGSVALLLTLLF